VRFVMGDGSTLSDLTEDTDLVGSGLMDSFSLVALVLQLQEDFTIVIQPEEITLASFGSIREIVNFVYPRMIDAGG
jgi:acyl carrier protein